MCDTESGPCWGWLGLACETIKHHLHATVHPQFWCLSCKRAPVDACRGYYGMHVIGQAVTLFKSCECCVCVTREYCVMLFVLAVWDLAQYTCVLIAY